MTKVTYNGFVEPVIRDFGPLPSPGGTRLELGIHFGGGRFAYLLSYDHSTSTPQHDRMIVADVMLNGFDFEHLGTRDLDANRFRHDFTNLSGTLYRRNREYLGTSSWMRQRQCSAPFGQLGWAALVTQSTTTSRVALRAIHHDGSGTSWPEYTAGDGPRLKTIWEQPAGTGDWVQDAIVHAAEDGSVVVAYQVNVERGSGYPEQLRARYCRMVDGELVVGPEHILRELPGWGAGQPESRFYIVSLIPMGARMVIVYQAFASPSSTLDPALNCMVIDEQGVVDNKVAFQGTWYDWDSNGTFIRSADRVMLAHVPSVEGATFEARAASVSSAGLSDFADVPVDLGDFDGDFGGSATYLDPQQHGQHGVVLNPTANYAPDRLNVISLDPTGKAKVSTLVLPEGSEQEVVRNVLGAGARQASFVLTDPHRLAILKRSLLVSGSPWTEHLWGAVIDVTIEQPPPTVITGRYRSQRTYFERAS